MAEDPDDFYVEDEPLEDILRAWDQGEKCRTEAPSGWTPMDTLRARHDPGSGQTFTNRGVVKYATTSNPYGLTVDFGEGPV